MDRGLIVVNVIFDKETRELISEFAVLSTREISMLINQIRQFKSLKPEVDKLRATLSDLQKQAALIPQQRAG
jgi:prefoldin subunit 5